jgi:membrane-associated protease RseP (regulator of RpoE activity)
MLYQMEGNSILYLLAKLAAFGKLLPAPISYGSTPPVLYWLQYFFTGTPTPWGALDVNLSPVAWAGWIGLLVTSLNLLPVGMLDGGHIFYTLFGREKALKLYPFILVALVALGFASNSWWLWAFLLFLFGRVYAEPLDQITELDPRRRKLAWLALIILILTFTPVPLMLLV